MEEDQRLVRVDFLDAFSHAVEASRRKRLRRRIRRAGERFDYLPGHTVTVARLKPNKEYVRNPIAAADSYNRLIYIPIDESVTDITLFHELAHLDIRLAHEAGEDVPTTSENFCSIYAVARMPIDRIDGDRIPYLGYPSTSPEEWPEICQRALSYREEHRNYIQKAGEWLDI